MTIHEMREIVYDEVRFPDYEFVILEKEPGVALLQAIYMDRDVHNGHVGEQRTRKWYLSTHMTKSEIVQTCLKCILTSMEHRVREHFTYRGERIFGPHFDCEALVNVAREKRLSRRAEGDGNSSHGDVDEPAAPRLDAGSAGPTAEKSERILNDE